MSNPNLYYINRLPWKSLNEVLMKENISEEKILESIALELKEGNRRSYIVRMYGRLSQLRKERELKEFGL